MDSWWPAGDGSTLSLDFTTGTLDPLLTFTRSSSGTYLGSDGLVKTAGSNVARFDYDTSGTPLGLLIEGSTTNLLAHTERLDEAQVSTEQYWITTYGVTGVTAATTGPDGVSNSATQFAPLAGSGTCIASAAMGTSAQRSFSFWAKRSSGSTNLEYTLDNGTTWVAVTTTSSWQRFKIAATTAAQRVGFRFAANNVYEIWGCQLEAGSGSSSYVKNVSAVAGATRNADVCNMTGANFSSWFTQGAGTIVAHSDIVKANGRNLLCQISNASNTYIQMGNKALASAGEAIGYLVSGSIAGYTDSNNNPSLNTAYKSAYVWETNYFNVCVNATLAIADTSGNIASSGMTQMCIGADATVPTDAYIKNGHIRLLKYWPYRLPNAQIQSLTT
jgi:hypothetical protein